MSIYGAIELVSNPKITLEKKRFAKNNTLRFTNAAYVGAYYSNTLDPIVVQEDGNAKVVDTGNTTGAVTVTISPNSVISNIQMVDTMYDYTLAPNLSCVVLEGAVTMVDPLEEVGDSGNRVVYSSSKNIPIIKSTDNSIELKVFGQTKLLIYQET